MRQYLRPIGDATKFSGLADYPNAPDAPSGFEWVQGEPPPEAQPYVEPTLTDQLNAVFETLDEDTQADLSPLKAAVKVELEQERTTIAKKIIARASIPAELEPLRTAMLEEFPS